MCVFIYIDINTAYFRLKITLMPIRQLSWEVRHSVLILKNGLNHGWGESLHPLKKNWTQ